MLRTIKTYANLKGSELKMKFNSGKYTCSTSCWEAQIGNQTGDYLPIWWRSVWHLDSTTVSSKETFWITKNRKLDGRYLILISWSHTCQWFTDKHLPPALILPRITSGVFRLCKWNSSAKTDAITGYRFFYRINAQHRETPIKRTPN